MNRRKDGEKRVEDFISFLKTSALPAVASVADFLANFQYDKWFVRLKNPNHLSNFMSWFNNNTMNDQDFNEEEISEENAAENSFDGNSPFDEPVEAAAKSGASKSKLPEVLRLESELKIERERRESAEAKLVGVQKKFDEVKTQMERETQEMRARLMKTLEDRAKQGQFNFLTTLLPVLDNLSLAIEHAEKDASFENLIGGVKGTARSFEQALTNVGVESIPAVGTAFNPELHEAVDMIPVASAGDDDDKITAEYSRGYRFGEKLLRPAKVQVGKAGAKHSAVE